MLSVISVERLGYAVCPARLSRILEFVPGKRDQMALAKVAAAIKLKYWNCKVTTVDCVLGNPDAPQPCPILCASQL